MEVACEIQGERARRACWTLPGGRRTTSRSPQPPPTEKKAARKVEAAPKVKANRVKKFVRFAKTADGREMCHRHRRGACGAG